MAENLLISIITINFNNLVGLKKTMTSVLGQTWTGFEYIVIDGGSTDGSAAYIESQKDRIDYWVSEPDSGIYNAMNKGIKVATGEYLLFLNSGDALFSNEILHQNYKFLTLYDIIYFNLNVVDEKKTFIKKYPDQLLFSYFVNDTLPHPATFIRKTIFNKIGLYDESLKIVSDWKFFIQSICKFNYTYKRIDATLATFYLDGLSSEPSNGIIILAEKQKVLKSDFQAYLEENKLLFELKKTVANLRESKKIKLLLKLGLLNRF